MSDCQARIEALKYRARAQPQESAKIVEYDPTKPLNLMPEKMKPEV